MIEAKEKRPCTQAEIDEWSKFAPLPISERKRIIYENFIKYLPDSPLSKEIIANGLHLKPEPKRRKARTVKSKSPIQKSLFKERRKDITLWK